jgi:hypothetical protein
MAEKNCCVCNCQTIIKSKRDEDGDVWRYCSDECFQYKTPQVKRLEKLFQKDITEILIYAFRMFESNEARLDFLGVTDPTMRTWVKRFFLMNMKQFFEYVKREKNEFE